MYFSNVEKMNRYKIQKELGGQRKRKFGQTFLAEDQLNHSNVVLKQFDKTAKNEHLFELTSSESLFSFEIKGLPKVIDSFSIDNQTFLVLQYKNGVTIDHFWAKLKRKQRLSFLIKFLEKFTPILKTLEDQKVVHCDIKPSNILIEEKEGDFNVHLIDFGLAIKNNQSKRKTLFPLGYAAPELILNELSIIDFRTDQFSLGILIWRLYTGELPLSHRNPSVFTNLQITHPLPSHSKVPKKVFRILNKMTNKHQFSLPPNRINKEDVKEHLKKAMHVRYTDFYEIIDELKGIKPLFYHIRSLR